jgi:Flp pilus assembly protein TadD
MTHTASHPAVVDCRRRAYDALRVGEADTAFAELESAFAADSHDPEVLCDLATLALTHGEPASALDFARHALTLDATHAPSRAALALALAAEGSHAEARPLLEALRASSLPAGLRDALARVSATA